MNDLDWQGMPGPVIADDSMVKPVVPNGIWNSQLTCFSAT